MPLILYSSIMILMEFDQEEALYEFLENTTKPFNLNEITNYVQDSKHKHDKKLSMEIAAYLDARKIAFRYDNQHWISRRGCFESARFVITPSRLELLNGILIPGHRCVPFANPLALPQKYKFFWNGNPVPVTTTEAAPEELYPYYSLYSEEFAPQYIARDNPENENAFNADPYEDPPEVSIHTLDMRQIYRESSFIPGDCFAVRILDWKECRFELSKVKKDDWKRDDLNKWIEAAESGFENSFALLGPGSSMEEQFAFAYWFGGKRMREIPAYSLEEFLFEKTNRVDIMPYGIESRCWFAGKEIPDNNSLQSFSVPPDRTYVEEMLFQKNIPISEYVIFSYIKDALFRKETANNIEQIINRLVPPIVNLEEIEWGLLADYISECIEDFSQGYSGFLDRKAGPVRQRVIELHTAVIELAARLQKGEIEMTWLPRHTFIVLTQIHGHAAALLEDLAFDETPPESDLLAMENSLDSMIDTFADIKELIRSAMDNFRRSNLTIIHGGKTEGQMWRMIQIGITGLDVWRRAIISHDCTMEKLHLMIQIGMNWNNKSRFRFYCETPDGGKEYLHDKIKLGDIDFPCKKELVYEYARWNVKIIIMSLYQGSANEVSQMKQCPRFVTGEGAAPPEQVDGVLHFKRLIGSLETGGIAERQSAQRELGLDKSSGVFDLERMNRELKDIF